MGLNLAKEDGDVAVPYNKSGRRCPLNQKPVKDVCHKCELWQPLDLIVNGETKQIWRCAFNWQAILSARANLALAEIDREVHQTNKELGGFRQSVGMLVGEMARASNLIEAERPPKLIEVIDAPEADNAGPAT